MYALKYVAVAALAFTFTGLAVMPANADTPAAPQTQPVTASVIGGNLTASLSGLANPLSVTLNGGTSLSATSPASSPWTLVDARGTGAAWGLSVSGTDFVSAAGDTDSTARTMPIGDLSITPGTISSLSGASVLPTAGTLQVSTTSQVLVTASANAMGTFSFTPDFTLLVAGSAYRSNFVHGTSGAVNAYTSTLTFTIA